jgi:DNA-binding transcriptional MerR regulator
MMKQDKNSKKDRKPNKSDKTEENRGFMSIRRLRHYDSIGVFHPALRKKNYRWYSPTQITTIKKIRVLMEIGVPLDTISVLTKDRSPEKLLRLLNENLDAVSEDLRYLQEVHSIISVFMSLLYEGTRISENGISVSVMPRKNIILGDVNNYEGKEGFLDEYMRFCNAPHVPKLNLSFPIGGYFDDADAFMKDPSKPTRFFSLDPKGREYKEEGLYLIGYTRGYYGQTNGLSQRMMDFAQRKGLLFSGPVYQTYLFDELSTMNHDQYLLQVAAFVTETRRITPVRPRMLTNIE